MDEEKAAAFLEKERYNTVLLVAIILGCMLVTLYINLVMGIDVVYTHLYYIPIILAGIWYHRKAVYVALFLGLAHIAIAYSVTGHFVMDTLIRAAIFLVVALVVGTLSKNRDRLLTDLRLILESTDEGIYGVDEVGRCTFINQSALRMLGFKRSEILGKFTHDLIHHTRRDGTKCSPEECCVLQSLRTGIGCRDSDDVFWRKDGSSFPVEYSSSPILVDGRISGAVISFVDITRRNIAEGEIRDARRQAELYVDLMAHDINNMNQIGISYLELGLNELRLGDGDKVYLQKPLEALRNSSRLIDTVRKLQKVREGGLRHENTDLCRILQDVASEYSRIPGRDVAINLELQCGCHVLADELLRDVFSNIVGNAVKHSSRHIAVNIIAGTVFEGGLPFSRVDISDTGPGIPDDVKKKLFRRHQRGNEAVSGHGLGLYLVKKLVDGFGGMVWVEDRVPGDYTQGAKFVVMLPAYKEKGP